MSILGQLENLVLVVSQFLNLALDLADPVVVVADVVLICVFSKKWQMYPWSPTGRDPNSAREASGSLAPG